MVASSGASVDSSANLTRLLLGSSDVCEVKGWSRIEGEALDLDRDAD
jgi:hypothetical protein